MEKLKEMESNKEDKRTKHKVESPPPTGAGGKVSKTVMILLIVGMSACHTEAEVTPPGIGG